MSFKWIFLAQIFWLFFCCFKRNPLIFRFFAKYSHLGLGGDQGTDLRGLRIHLISIHFNHDLISTYVIHVRNIAVNIWFRPDIWLLFWIREK